MLMKKRDDTTLVSSTSFFFLSWIFPQREDFEPTKLGHPNCACTIVALSPYEGVYMRHWNYNSHLVRNPILES